MGVRNVTWTDVEILDVLDKRYRVGLSVVRIAGMKGVTKNAIIGLLHRINSETDKAEAGSTVAKPENMDGALSPRWWASRRAA
jgi:hypothetical protein